LSCLNGSASEEQLMIQISIAETLLALLLLTGAVDHSAVPASPGQRAALRVLALHFELMESWEVRSLLLNAEDWPSDTQALQERWTSRAQAPAVSDASRFPERCRVLELLSFNRAYRQHLAVRQAAEPHRYWEIRNLLQETDRLHHIWSLVHDAGCEHYHVIARRQALKDLKEALGENAYYAAQLPPHVPFWAFAPSPY